MKLRAKLLAGLGGVLVTLLAICVLCNFIIRRYGQSIETLLSQDYQSAVACQSMKESLESLLKLAQQRVWSDENVTNANSQEAVGAFERSLNKQLLAVDVPGEADATDRLVNLWHGFLSTYGKLSTPGLSEPQRRDLFLNQILPPADDLRAQAQKIIDMNLDYLNTGREQIRLAAAHAQWAVDVLTAAGTGVIVIIVVLCGVIVLRPVQLLTRSVNEIAAGNLDLIVPIRSRDEIGMLARAFNQMAGQLRHFKRIDQDRLLRTQRTTQLAIDALPDAIVIIDPSGLIELTNETASRLFRLKPGQRVAETGLAWLSDLHSHSLSDHEPHIGNAYKSAIKVDDHGMTRYLLPRTYPIRDANNELIGIAIFLADVTDFQRLDEMKNDMLSTVAHELKTPLTSMRMITHLLNEQLKGKVSDRHLKLLDASREDSDRLHQIVEELLDIGRLESGRAALNCRRMMAGELVRSCVEPMRQAVESHGLKLVLEIPEEATFVHADEDRLRRVFVNILANSMKYTPDGGAVTVSLSQQDGEVHFSIADTGRGIPRRYLPRVFEKFFRVPGQPGDSGTGLGLTIVKEIIEAHGGHIDIDSREGCGTTIHFALPMAVGAESEVQYANR